MRLMMRTGAKTRCVQGLAEAGERKETESK